MTLTKEYPHQRVERVIFLDIDGVINVNSAKIISEPHIDYTKHPLYKELNVNHVIEKAKRGWNSDSLWVLKSICQLGGIGIVISSNWRLGLTFEQLRFMFDLYDLGQYIVGSTCYINGHRGFEISRYLEQQPKIKHYVILDDKDYGISHLHPDQFIRIYNRLTDQHYGQILLIIPNQSWAQLNPTLLKSYL